MPRLTLWRPAATRSTLPAACWSDRLAGLVFASVSVAALSTLPALSTLSARGIATGATSSPWARLSHAAPRPH